MRIKGWEQQKKGLSKKFKEVRYNLTNSAVFMNITYDGERWNVWLGDFPGYGEQLNKKGFKTKAQALKFALKERKRISKEVF